MSKRNNDTRFVDYFLVAGLPRDIKLEFIQDDVRNLTENGPIIDLVVINRSQGEASPPGYQCVEFTPTGLDANLNHGSIRSPNMYLCYRRGRDKPIIVEIGVIYESKEQASSDVHVIRTTPSGLSANVNNSSVGSDNIFITYRRADVTADCNTLAVVDICIIIPNKGDSCPHAYCKVDKTLNKGMLQFAPDVFLCYKKSLVTMVVCSHEAAILGRYPLTDHAGFALPSAVAMFCLPLGASVECWPAGVHYPLPVFSTFVLTGDTGVKIYGAAIIFYDDFDETKFTDAQRQLIGLTSPTDGKRVSTLHQNKSICFLSRWPFFDAMRSLLLYIYRISVSGPQPVPIERYIGHYMTNVPFPSPQKPRIFIQLNTKAVILSQPEDTSLPRSGASFITLLKNLRADNCISLLLYALLEHKLLIHSLRPDVLTSVAEAVTSMIFPLRWPCPYIPLCPLALADVLDSPTPFIIGMDSRYFDTNEPSPELTLVDVDTNTITLSKDKSSHTIKLLPKRPVKMLRSTLEMLYDKIITTFSGPEAIAEKSSLSLEVINSHKIMALEASIQEAFLHFMAALFYSYADFLLPITAAPTERTTDIKSLFNIDGFLRNVDRSSQKFYRLLTSSQAFCHFIEERSFGSDLLGADGSRRSGDLAFFDDCVERLGDEDVGRGFIEIDENLPPSPLTVMVMPPEPLGLPPDALYSFSGFENLRPDYFLPETTEDHLSVNSNNSNNNNNNNGTLPSASKHNAQFLKRTKQEVKFSQREITNCANHPKYWANCLAWYGYSVWFLHLASYLKSSPRDASDRLHKAFVLLSQQLHKLTVPVFDETCYRAIMYQCGRWSEPALAVRVLFEMQRHGLTPNAVTYGVYNKVLLESRWPSHKAGVRLLWRRLCNVVIAVGRFQTGSRHSSADDEVTRSSQVVAGGHLEVDGTSLATSGYGSMLLPESQSQVPDLSDQPEQASSDGVEMRDKRISDVDGILHANRTSVINDDACTAVKISRQISICRRRPSHDNDNPTDLKLLDIDISEDTERLPTALPALKYGSEDALEKLSEKHVPDGDFGRIRGRLLPKGHGFETVAAGELTKKSHSLQELTTDPMKLRKGRTMEMTLPVTPRRSEPQRNDGSKTLQPAAASTPSRRSSFGTLVWQKATSAFSSRYRGWRSTLKAASSDWLNSNGKEEDVVTNENETSSKNSLDGSRSTLDQLVPGDDEFSSDVESQTNGGRSGGFSGSVADDIAEQIDMCSTSKCPYCGNLLYDEEIMAGWSTDDSNLKTFCANCSHQFLAELHIMIHDYRHVHKPKKVIAKRSTENLLSGNESLMLNDSLDCSRDTLVASLNQSAEQDEEQEQEQDSEDNVIRYVVNVPYLNPVVLRKEMETLLEHDGEECLNTAKFADNHANIFWNLVWYFKRLNLPSHIEGYILTASSLNYQALAPPCWKFASRQHVVVRALWDMPHTYKDFGPPMYVQWQQGLKAFDESYSGVLLFNKSAMQQIVSSVMCDNVLVPIQKILAERSKNSAAVAKQSQRSNPIVYRSIYREILFLMFVALGRDNIEIDAYDFTFRKTLEGLANRVQESIRHIDRPPDAASVWCRKLFTDLDL